MVATASHIHVRSSSKFAGRIETNFVFNLSPTQKIQGMLSQEISTNGGSVQAISTKRSYQNSCEIIIGLSRSGGRGLQCVQNEM
jgi:hypothetical protein